MKSSLKSLIFLIVVLFSSTLFAQTGVKLKQLSTQDGLNQSGITSIIQDNEGYLWIASQQGVNRYDGYRLYQIPSPDNKLSYNYVELIYQDSMGKIWFGGSFQSNFVLDKAKNSLTPITLPNPKDGELKFPTINRIFEDKAQNLWIATYLDLIFYERKTGQFTLIKNLNDFFNNDKDQHSIRELLLIDSSLLIATSNGLYAMDIDSQKVTPIKHTPYDAPNKDQINVKALQIDAYGDLLIGTVEGLYKIKRKHFGAFKSKETPSHASVLVTDLNIWQIIQKPGFYWLATDQGLYKFFESEELEHVFKFSDTPYNTSDDNIVRLIEDKEGNLWMGSRADGVFKWKPNPAIRAHYWHKGPKQQQLTNDEVLSVHRTTDNKILIGTKNGLNTLDPKTHQISQALINPDKKAVYSESSIYQIVENDNELWLNTQSGLRIVNSQTLEPSQRVLPKTEKDIFKGFISYLHFFDEKTLGVVTQDGIYHYDLESNQVDFIEQSQTNGQVSMMLGAIFNVATGDRESYFISGSDRLAKYNRLTGKVETFHQLPPSDTVRTYVADVHRDNDKLWVTYPGYGLYLLDANTGEEIKFISEKSLGTNTMMDMFDDEHGNLWIISNEGLIRLNKTNFNSRVFDKEDGFATSEFNGGTRLKLPNGEVYLGTIKGLYQLDPSMMINRKSREIVNRITNLTILSKSIPSQYGSYNDYALTLAHDDFGIQIEFSPLLLEKPEQVKFKYWFEGGTKVEPTLISDSKLFLPTIEEGKTTLLISAIDYETGQESKPARLLIHSKPAPWLSKEAYAAYLISAFLIIWFNYRRYTKRAIARQKAHRKLRQSEERLNLALKGGNSGLWDWHAKDNLIYEPRISNEGEVGTELIPFETRVNAIHPNDRENFLLTWGKFILQNKKGFDVVYRMKNDSGDWAWYRDMATVSSTDANGNPTRVTGTFTNITERKEARDKMRLLSTAFENTRDIVFVLNEKKLVIAANQSFYKQTDFEIEKVLNQAMFFLTDSQGNRKLVAKIFKEVHSHTHWSGEGILKRQYKKPLPVLINATQFSSDDGQAQFVFALTDISEQKAAENELRKLANYDTLTGLPNRALLTDRITHALEHCRRKKEQLALFFIDLDRFKQINDTLGHDIGDLLLINVAHSIKESIRQDDTVARLGGDEFVVVLEDIHNIDVINRIARNIIEKMQEPMYLREHQVSVSPSIGIATYPNDGDEAEILLKHADIAMYHAKNAGRNNFQYFENSMNHAAKERLNIENDIRRGVTQDEFYLVYQPQINLQTGKICGVEALARWRTQDGEIISPGEFIPIAEDIGLIIPITERLLECALQQLQSWHEAGFEISLAFNLSARHLHHYDFNSFIEDLLSRYPVKTHLLEFELTESILMKDMEVANRIFGKLAERGIELALDDFGTGYSSLKYLNQLPINKLKIDRSFVNRIGISPENDAIINTIISLAKSLNLKTVAEGIETEEQLNFMKAHEVDHAQGFYFSKPVSIDELLPLLKSQ